MRMLLFLMMLLAATDAIPCYSNSTLPSYTLLGASYHSVADNMVVINIQWPCYYNTTYNDIVFKQDGVVVHASSSVYNGTVLATFNSLKYMSSVIKPTVLFVIESDSLNCTNHLNRCAVPINPAFFTSQHTVSCKDSGIFNTGYQVVVHQSTSVNHSLMLSLIILLVVLGFSVATLLSKPTQLSHKQE